MAKGIKRTSRKKLARGNGLISSRQFDAAYRLASFGYSMELGSMAAEADYLEGKALLMDKQAGAKMTMATSKQTLAKAEEVIKSITPKETEKPE